MEDSKTNPEVQKWKKELEGKVKLNLSWKGKLNTFLRNQELFFFLDRNASFCFSFQITPLTLQLLLFFFRNR